MGELEKNKYKSGAETNQSKMKDDLLIIWIYLILFIIAVILFTKSFSWLFSGFDQFRLAHVTYYRGEGQPPAQAQPSILNYFAIPSIFTWLSGIIAAKIGNKLIDHCWHLIKYIVRKLWSRIKRRH